jgi:hypothetical protein
MSKPETKKPTKEFRVGGIKAAIWEDKEEKDGQVIFRHSIRIQKRFKPKDGEFTDTNYFFPEELPKLRLVIDKTFEFVSNLKENNGSEPPV